MNGHTDGPGGGRDLPARGKADRAVRQPAGDTSPAPVSHGAQIDTFLNDAKRLAPAATGQAGRLVFALDATMSRQPTWDAAMQVQGEMFRVAGETGGLMVQLVYFRGMGECRASRWVADARALTDLMTRIDCRGGHTQIGRVLTHIRDEARSGRIGAFVLVGDAMEERIDDLCAVAGELGLMGIKGFLFQEGTDPAATAAFREMARLTRGVHARFDAGAPGRLADLLRAAAAYAGGGIAALERLAARDGGQASALLADLHGRR